MDQHTEALVTELALLEQSWSSICPQPASYCYKTANSRNQIKNIKKIVTLTYTAAVHRVFNLSVKSPKSDLK